MQTDRIRILQVVGKLNVGGLENMVMNLYRHIDRENYVFEFAVLCGSERGFYEKELEKDGTKVYHLTKRSESFWKHHRDLYDLLKNGEYDVIHFHTQNAFLTSLHICVARRACHSAIVVHCHSTSDPKGNRVRLFLHHVFQKFLYRSADVKIACSRKAAEWLYGTAKNIVIFPIPVDCKKYLLSSEKRNLLRQKYGVSDQKVYCHAGRFSKEKNHEFLIQVMYEVFRREENSVLFLLGDGDTRQSIEKLVKDLKIEEKVRFFGMVEDVNEKMMACDVFVMPSFFEGFPTGALEAQASGLPCLLSAEITKDICLTEGARRFPLEKGPEEWAELLTKIQPNDEETRQKYNSVIAEKYDIGTVTQKMQEIYRKAADR